METLRCRNSAGNLLFSVFTAEEVLQWAWRIPFLLSLPLGILIAILRRVLPADAPLESDCQSPSPVVRVLKEHTSLVIRGALLGWGSAASFYLVAVFLSSYLATEHYLDQKSALAALVVVTSLATICTAWTLKDTTRKALR
jgi:MHS family proline/betaine transporter-like MFS transporter